jgi:hypothetical protein
MSPITEDLHELVAKLEARVRDLEHKVHLAAGGSTLSDMKSENVRMILMGPPGAGIEFPFLGLLMLSDESLPRYFD